MDYSYLSELLFPDVKTTAEELEAKYPERNLPDGAVVARFAPSPTGFVHFGGFFPVMAGERLAHRSGGVFYLRIEDTDSRREVEGAADALVRTLSHYGVEFDEGETATDEVGAYGPYRQSRRVDIYHVFAKLLVASGRAYPVFSTDEELDAINTADKKAEIKSVDWERDAEARREAMLKQREFTVEYVERELAAGHKFALYVLADGDGERKIKFTDLVRGALLLPENDEDFVLLKSDGVPTYHFAHVVDDHLMRTTHVIRGEEWLPSLPKHLMLFRYLGWRAPKYMHISQLMKLDPDGSKKKLSKRDMGANMDDYKRLGYDPAAVTEYVMTLLNSNYEEWRAQNRDKSYRDFPFSVKKMSVSGCLFDIKKLDDVSREVVSRMSSDYIYSALTEWAGEYRPDFASLLSGDENFAKAIISIGRGGKKPRKDYGTWVELVDFMSMFYDETFRVSDEYPEGTDTGDVISVIDAFISSYDEGDDMNAWFEKIKKIGAPLGYCPDMKEYRANPDAYKGSVADVSMMLRVAVTGRLNSPDLYTFMHIIGKNAVISRLTSMKAAISSVNPEV
ncbi:MAG: glutamate--tRNA ligase family protein [Firmicutes bacterium]|nr:glutamate--tRNA ligase family protein [Bacillota bacterium]